MDTPSGILRLLRLNASSYCARSFLAASFRRAAVWLLAASAAARAEENKLEVRLAPSFGQIRDDLLTPIAFEGPMLALQILYARSLGTGLLETSLRIGGGYLQDRYGVSEQGMVGQVEVRHELALAYLLGVGGPESALSLGPSTRLASDIYYAGSWDDSHLYWLADWCLGPVARYERDAWGLGRVRARVEFALVGLVSRPPAQRLNTIDRLTKLDSYFNRIGQSPRLTALNHLQELRIEIGLLRRRSTFAAGWEFGFESRFIHASFPADLLLLQLGAYVAKEWTW